MRRTFLIALLAVAPAAGGQATEDFKLTAADAAAGDEFGRSIAIEHDIVAVGVTKADNNGADSGSAYLFDASTGAQLAKLLPSDAAAGDWFGYSIAIRDGLVAVGARRSDDNGTDSGCAYLFDASTGVQVTKLLPSDGGPGDEFGYSVAIGDGIVAVGAIYTDDLGINSGSVYMFDASTGAQINKLLPNDGAAGDLFGNSLAIDNGVIGAGALFDDDLGDQSGSAYLFDASTGTQLFKLLPNDGSAVDQFGVSIALANGSVVVGAWLDDHAGTDSGSAYLFDASTGVQTAKLSPCDATPNANFGYSVAMDSDIVAIGASHVTDSGDGSGSAYLFDAVTGIQRAKFVASDGAADDRFGISIAIDTATTAVGSFHDDDTGANSGSAYTYTTPVPCTGDIANDTGCVASDGMVSFGDFLALLGLVGPCPGGVPGCTGDIADDFGTLNGGDGMVSFGDFLALLGLVGPCP